MHEMFVTLVQAGFTERQALIMVCEMARGGRGSGGDEARGA
jgi:hypothetical protein